MNKELWHYDRLSQWENQYYKNVMLPVNLTGDEIAVGTDDDKQFFYVAKKDKKLWVIPSEIIDKGEIPFLIKNSAKMGIRGKVFQAVTNYQDVSIKSDKTMSYKEMIDNWMDYEHEVREKYILWKIIVDCAYNSRVNVRVITHPGWMKDSPLFTLGRLKGNCFAVNRPTLAKLKYLMNDSTRILGLNEIQKLKTEEIEHLAKFYEDIGDFKTQYVNPSRSSAGVSEMCNISNISTLTFSNFPASNKDFDAQKEELFDFIFHPKIRSRIFPIMFDGGTETEPACKERFPHVTAKLTQEQHDEITNWLRNFIYYEQNGRELAGKKEFKNGYFMKNNRWDRNFQAICERIKLYCDTQEEFDKMTKLLYDCHQAYLDYVKNMGKDEPMIVTEEQMI